MFHETDKDYETDLKYSKSSTRVTLHITLYKKKEAKRKRYIIGYNQTHNKKVKTQT